MKDERLPGGYENVPTVDIHMRQISFHDQWLHILDTYVKPIQQVAFSGYKDSVRIFITPSLSYPSVCLLCLGNPTPSLYTCVFVVVANLGSSRSLWPRMFFFAFFFLARNRIAVLKVATRTCRRLTSIWTKLACTNSGFSSSSITYIPLLKKFSRGTPAMCVSFYLIWYFTHLFLTYESLYIETWSMCQSAFHCLISNFGRSLRQFHYDHSILWYFWYLIFCWSIVCWNHTAPKGNNELRCSVQAWRAAGLAPSPRQLNLHHQYCSEQGWHRLWGNLVMNVNESYNLVSLQLLWTRMLTSDTSFLGESPNFGPLVTCFDNQYSYNW